MIAKSLILSVLCTLATLITIAVVIYDDPPAIVGYIFGFLCGAGWTGIAAMFVFRQLTHD